MKRPIAILVFLLCVASPSYAGSLITATITVTNTPADGDTITVNGSARTWKTTVATPSTQIVIGASIGANATNMFSQFSGNGFATLTLNRSGTNGVTLRGIVDQTLTVSIGGTWGNYSLAPNSVTNLVAVATPASAYPVQSTATNNYSQVASDLGVYSTNALAAGTALVGNLVQTSGAQTVAGAKTFTGLVSTNTRSISFAGNASVLTTNGVVFVKDASAVSTNTLYIITADATGWPGVYDSGGNAVTAEPDSLGGIVTLAHLKAFYPLLEDNGGATTNTWNTAQKFIDPVFAASIQATNATIQAGTVSASLTNTVEYSGGPVMQTVSSLANGNNAAVPTTGYRFIKLTSGPTGAFTINGLAGGGIRELDIYNNTGQNMTIAHQSGTDPVATNRIVSMTGADQSTTGDGWAHFIYDTTAARWILKSLSP